MYRIVDIATDDLHLSAYRGFLVASLDRQEQGRVALDDIQAVIVHAHGVTWTTSLVVALAVRGAVMVLCAANHSPVAILSPIDRPPENCSASVRARGWLYGYILGDAAYSINKK